MSFVKYSKRFIEVVVKSASLKIFKSEIDPHLSKGNLMTGRL